MDSTTSNSTAFFLSAATETIIQAFNIAKAVTRFSLGLSKKDETGLIDRFLERIESNSATGYFDDAAGEDSRLKAASTSTR